MGGLSWSLIGFVWFLALFCEQTSSECTQLTPCSCMFPDGQGYDLSSLRKSSPFQATNGSYTFYFHPCTNAPLSNNQTSECHQKNGVSLCVEYKNNTINLGSVEETKVEIGSDKLKTPSLILRHGNYTSSVALVCCEFCNSHLISDTDIKNDFHLILVSSYACKMFIHPKGLSVGSILLIYFFVFTGIYFIGGAIALKLLRGATGWEMIPNLSFWWELLSLVKDGIAFTFNCCRVDGYDRI